MRNHPSHTPYHVCFQARLKVKKAKEERRVKCQRLKEDNTKVFIEKVIKEVEWEMTLKWSIFGQK